MDVLAIVMAAGKGTRMQADRAKVLFEVCDRPMIEFVLDALERVGVDRILVVVGYQAEKVRVTLNHRRNVTFVEQTEQLGTGHAVMVCRDELEKHSGAVVVLAGDSPLVQDSSLRALLEEHSRGQTACILGTLEKDDPCGLGRIVRDEQRQFVGIVEEKDTTDEQRQIREVNMSTYVFDQEDLLFALDRLSNDNQQSEYYITDCPGILLREGRAVRALPVLRACEALSINTVEELEMVEAEMRKAGH